jgi:hypothetical protein
LCASGLLLMLPTWQGAWLIADLAGLILGVVLVIWEKSQGTSMATSPAESRALR